MQTPSLLEWPTLVNGQYDDKLSVYDRGIQYGDGLFETLAVENGHPYLWDQHMERLVAGCQRLGIPPIDLELLALEADKICSTCLQGVLKILITRGEGGRGYKPPDIVAPTRILSLHPRATDLRHWWKEGVRVCLCQTRLGVNPTLAGIKHTNRLEQVLARAEWNDPDIAEGLMQDLNGYWIAGTKTNLFLVEQESILTPKLDYCGVNGTMRNLVMYRARQQGWQVIEQPISEDKLRQAKGIILTNSLIGIWPVSNLAGFCYDPDAIPIHLRRSWLQAATYSDIAL